VAVDPRWEAFAAREPYFAILTSPRFLRAQFTEEREREFFESGQTLVDYICQLIEERVAPDFAPTAILEYGCGVGRLALPLARRAGARGGTVVAVDHSPAMLAAARGEAERRGIRNAAFRTPSEFDEDDAARVFDLICCVLVLQRMPQDAGLALIRWLLSRLAPGGIAVFSVPYASTASPAVQATRWVRRHVPGVNAALNLARRRAPGEPFLASHTYDLSRVMSVVQEQLVGTMNVLLEPQEGLNTALLFVEAPIAAETGRRLPVPAPGTTGRAGVVDVATLIQETSIDDLNRSAEEYFASLKDWEHHLTKPFSQAHETPTLLASMAAATARLTPHQAPLCGRW
jgi:SAM-dependent methyltransferase